MGNSRTRRSFGHYAGRSPLPVTPGHATRLRPSAAQRRRRSVVFDHHDCYGITTRFSWPIFGVRRRDLIRVFSAAAAPAAARDLRARRQRDGAKVEGVRRWHGAWYPVTRHECNGWPPSDAQPLASRSSTSPWQRLGAHQQTRSCPRSSESRAIFTGSQRSRAS